MSSYLLEFVLQNFQFRQIYNRFYFCLERKFCIFISLSVQQRDISLLSSFYKIRLSCFYSFHNLSRTQGHFSLSQSSNSLIKLLHALSRIAYSLPNSYSPRGLCNLQDRFSFRSVFMACILSVHCSFPTGNSILLYHYVFANIKSAYQYLLKV